LTLPMFQLVLQKDMKGQIFHRSKWLQNQSIGSENSKKVMKLVNRHKQNRKNMKIELHLF
jgi:hypothetical protein